MKGVAGVEADVETFDWNGTISSLSLGENEGGDLEQIGVDVKRIRNRVCRLFLG
jgi:hypothetical protein